jgi:hypothetical protein
VLLRLSIGATGHSIPERSRSDPDGDRATVTRSDAAALSIGRHAR